MKTPGSWKNKGFYARLLLPVGMLYSAATAFRFKLKQPRKVPVPVICIGNLTAGGTGKTPTAAEIANLLKKGGYKPAFVSRGYGGSLCGVTVDPQKHTAGEVGDEPLLLAREAPVSINPDRFSAAQKAVKNGADVLIMDDGFQNPGLYKDLSFLIFDGAAGIGNGWPVPAGPLRENFAAGLKRAQAAVIIGEDRSNLIGRLKELPVFKAKIVSEPPTLTSDKVIAFAGIGRPEKFYDSLREHGIEPIKTFDFPDHHFYDRQELENLLRQAQAEKAELITTAKDFVKIPSQMQPHFKVLEIKIKWEDEDLLRQFIYERIRSLQKDVLPGSTTKTE